MATAVTAKLVGCIPKDRSGQAFGLISVITLLPYAVMPPLLEPLTRWVGSFRGVLDLSAAVMLLSFPVLAFVGGRRMGRIRLQSDSMAGRQREPQGLTNPVAALSFPGGMDRVYSDLLLSEGLRNQNRSAESRMVFHVVHVYRDRVRLVAGSLFDKVGKAWVLAGSLGWLAAGYIAMAHLSEPTTFYAMGLLLGLDGALPCPC